MGALGENCAPIVNRVVAWKATDSSISCKGVKQGVQFACIRCPNAQEAPNEKQSLTSQVSNLLARAICVEMPLLDIY